MTNIIVVLEDFCEKPGGLNDWVGPNHRQAESADDKTGIMLYNTASTYSIYFGAQATCYYY
jgi:hypothetical protein